MPRRRSASDVVVAARRRSTCVAVLFAVGFTAHSAAILAQPRPLEVALADPVVQAAERQIDTDRDWTANLLVQLGSIVSPSGHEQRRAEAVAATMREIGLQQVSVDGAPNAIGVVPGRSGRAVVFVSTLDDLGPVADFQKAAGHPPGSNRPV